MPYSLVRPLIIRRFYAGLSVSPSKRNLDQHDQLRGFDGGCSDGSISLVGTVNLQVASKFVLRGKERGAVNRWFASHGGFVVSGPALTALLTYLHTQLGRCHEKLKALMSTQVVELTPEVNLSRQWVTAHSGAGRKFLSS